jgi:hypothetical protein
MLRMENIKPGVRIKYTGPHACMHGPLTVGKNFIGDYYVTCGCGSDHPLSLLANTDGTLPDFEWADPPTMAVEPEFAEVGEEKHPSAKSRFSDADRLGLRPGEVPFLVQIPFPEGFMERSYWTPLDLIVFCRIGAVGGILLFDNAILEEVIEAEKKLADVGLIERNDSKEWELTSRGEAFAELLRSTPLPQPTWIDPRNGELID